MLQVTTFMFYFASITHSFKIQPFLAAKQALTTLKMIDSLTDGRAGGPLAFFLLILT